MESELHKLAHCSGAAFAAFGLIACSEPDRSAIESTGGGENAASELEAARGLAGGNGLSIGDIDPSLFEPSITSQLVGDLDNEACRGAPVLDGSLSVADETDTDYVTVWCEYGLAGFAGDSFDNLRLEAVISVSGEAVPMLRVDYLGSDSANIAQYDVSFTTSGEKGVRGEAVRIEGLRQESGADESRFEIDVWLPPPSVETSRLIITFFPAVGTEFQVYDSSAIGSGKIHSLELLGETLSKPDGMSAIPR